MLTDRDRIFTNIYGMHDRTLRGAIARGHWDNTKSILVNGRDWIVEQMKIVLQRYNILYFYKNLKLASHLVLYVQHQGIYFE